MQGDQINDLAVKRLKSAPGTTAYLKEYKKARHDVGEELSETLQTKYKGMAQEWSERELPSRIKQRYVHGNDSSSFYLIDFFTLA
jgi:hypothetical protein